ncbi:MULTISPECIES: DUF5681 domain-containing protein [unclassified Mesorhizobium]|uniref:DUF5681 domain-containing protein n=1 Tax=unclassified Mesorhizobium TaxID=325217 RepID=UPI00112AB9EC|nr:MULTISPECIES: DUF5681 domain-containing protein [unclassified Mesorhizobium]TPK42632.1 hypothetical protein FJ550_29700 [Mesorhizobium sp. B2-5-2]TPL26752.1 hypothetical protein FJ946_13020 [Mesorhizobium sp. B2-4-7]TPL40530.1 hypothetical protein FJ961_17320 [Mesorhizobium sp. B2-4-5]TPM76804.1 hypothetical protein FJ968_03550 [Mesorhizobium sp. B2-1-6]TPN72467.1 hypothetical protein FJ985_29205 [Mesorhizobium sp. B1-1-2]
MSSTRFQPGKSGNPKGRPSGSRSRVTLACEKLLDADAKAITTKAIELAKTGDTVALRLCMDRIAPPRKGSPIRFTLPEMANSGDVRGAALAVLQAVAEGLMSPEEGGAVVPLIEAARRAIETDELGGRLDVLERAMEARKR